MAHSTDNTVDQVDRSRAALSKACSLRTISLLHGHACDRLLIFIRQDLSAWGDESLVEHVMNLSEHELAGYPEGLEFLEMQDPEFQAEVSHFRHVPGFLSWIQGGAHPHRIHHQQAYGLRRGHAHLDLTNRRVTLSSQHFIVSRERFDSLMNDPKERSWALSDARSAERVWSQELSLAWRESEFNHAISFFDHSLPTIAPGTTILARPRRDGSWLFEHPDSPTWLCVLPVGHPRPSREALFHDGQPPFDLVI